MVNRKISVDLKECSLRLWELGWDKEFIAETLCISTTSLYRWRKIFEEYNTVKHPPSPLIGRPRIIVSFVLWVRRGEIMSIYAVNDSRRSGWHCFLEGGSSDWSSSMLLGLSASRSWSTVRSSAKMSFSPSSLPLPPKISTDSVSLSLCRADVEPEVVVAWVVDFRAQGAGVLLTAPFFPLRVAFCCWAMRDGVATNQFWTEKYQDVSTACQWWA